MGIMNADQSAYAIYFEHCLLRYKADSLKNFIWILCRQ